MNDDSTLMELDSPSPARTWVGSLPNETILSEYKAAFQECNNLAEQLTALKLEAIHDGIMWGIIEKCFIVRPGPPKHQDPVTRIKLLGGYQATWIDLNTKLIEATHDAEILRKVVQKRGLMLNAEC